MNEREIGELRRTITPEKTGIQRIRGCLVAENREILSTFNGTLGMCSEREDEELLAIIKKTLSGTVGKNLIDIEFTTGQVLEGEEHKLLSELRSSALENDEAVDSLYKKIIESVHIEGGYIILLASDKYDVFAYGGDGKKKEDSTEVFSYILCSVCPVKLTKPQLSFYANEFHSIGASSVICPPQLGFIFPAFDDRAANIYGALMYTKDTYNSQSEFIDNLFKSEPPMPAGIQKQTFESILGDTVADECDIEVVTAVHERICTMMDDHKAAREPEPLMISKHTVKSVLSECGVAEEKLSEFDKKFDQSFGKGTTIPPKNIINTKRLEVKTPDVVINVNPERPDLIKTEIIDGTKYILIRAEDDVTVNGVSIKITKQ
ncbi:MAG: DUF4317 domain-containing protein [Clostridia bacterium]|nr:DUF4317 domain-containing protein [Clostridia bacterium]